MKTPAKLLFAAAIAILGGGTAYAQNPCVLCGLQVQVKDIDKTLASAAVKVLDFTVTEGWGNPHTIFPEPERSRRGNDGRANAGARASVIAAA